MKELSPRALRDRLRTHRPLLLDVREPREFAICHLDGAESVPMGRIPAWAETADPERETVVICHHGIRSRQVAMYLERRGFRNLINLAGGVEAWAREVDPHMDTC